MQGLIRPKLVILFEPFAYACLCIADFIKPFCVEYFFADRAIEALVISILLGGYWIYSCRLNADFGQPFFKRPRTSSRRARQLFRAC
jgi:hypothetical protein